MAEASWFDGPGLDDPQELEFVEALVRAASAGSLAGVDPKDTYRDAQAKGYGPGVRVGLVIPKLTCPHRVLRVSYEAGDRWTAPTLLSDWSDGINHRDPPGGYDGPSNDTDLWVCGLFAPPSVCAGWVSAWFARQLSRPVVRREWDQPASGPGASVLGRARTSAAIQWPAAQPAELLDSRGTFGRWSLTRQPPSREIQERP